MSIKDYIQKKREAMALKAESNRQTRELKSKLDRESLREEANDARVKLSELRQANKDKQTLAELKREKFKASKTGRFIAGVESFSSGGLNDIRSTNASMFGKSRGSSNDMFRGSDLGGGFGGDMFGFAKPKAKPKKKKQRRKGSKKKSGGKSITIKLG